MSDEHYGLDQCAEILGTTRPRQARFGWLRGDVSPSSGRSARLPVDGYWPANELVVEFQEKQHTESVPIFDRRATVSGIPRGEQRGLHDQRKAELIPAQGLRLVVIHKSEFEVRRDRIVRDRDRDIAIVRCRLES